MKPRAVGDKVDMKELGSVINVIKGQEIAEKIPVKPGKNGTSLMGKKIPAYVGKDKNHMMFEAPSLRGRKKLLITKDIVEKKHVPSINMVTEQKTA